jgi:hypothetical protein
MGTMKLQDKRIRLVRSRQILREVVEQSRSTRILYPLARTYLSKTWDYLYPAIMAKSWLSRAYKEIWDKCVPMLSQGRGASDSKSALETKGLRDMSVHRLLSLATTDTKLYNFVLRSAHHTAQEAQLLTEKGDGCGFMAYFLLQLTVLPRELLQRGTQV